MSNIGQRVAHLRKARGWKQEELAARAGLNSRFIGHIETGYRNPGRDTLIALADAFGVTVDELIRPKADDSDDTPPTGPAAQLAASAA